MGLSIPRQRARRILRRRASSRSGFTLLELFVAFLLLALFILPLLSIVHRSRVRASNYSILNEIQELAQRKLFERVYTYSEESIAAGSFETLAGTFDIEGRPEWSWEILPPVDKNEGGSQTLLSYKIRVIAPQMAAIRESGFERNRCTDMWDGMFDGGEEADTSWCMETQALPSISWYLEQQALQEAGFDTSLPTGGF